MKKKSFVTRILFLAIILIIGVGFIFTKPQKVLLVRKTNGI